jgi:hypothetical protein
MGELGQWHCEMGWPTQGLVLIGLDRFETLTPASIPHGSRLPVLKVDRSQVGGRGLLSPDGAVDLSRRSWLADSDGALRGGSLTRILELEAKG